MSEASPLRRDGSVEVVVGRQPVVDVHRETVGFELLYRPGDGADTAPTRDGQLMTVSVLLGALTFGVDELVGDRLVFCNADRDVLTGDTPITLPPQRTVIEVSEQAEIDDELVAGVLARKAEGYTIALDNLTWRERVEDLLPIADLVKIDLQAHDRAAVADLVERVRPFGVRLVAHKCESDEDVAWARDAGFELFQGYALQRPEVVRGTAIAPTALGQVKLAAELLSEDLSFDRIETILRGEPGLVVQVLNLASIGAAGSLRRTVGSLHEALVLMGTIRLRQWAALAIIGRHGLLHSDALVTGLVRARMCELLGQQRGLDRAQAFTAGLLSSLDLVLGVDLEELEAKLDLDPELAAAAFHRRTPLGELVAEVADHQQAVDEGRPSPSASGQADLVAAMAFCWATSYAKALDAVPAGAA